MTFEIGDRVRTNCEHHAKFLYTFEGIVDDTQGRIVTVYGSVTRGLGKSDNKYSQDLHVNVLELVDRCFEEVCWVCNKVKFVHDDIKTTFADPGFICQECEEKRKSFEKFMKGMLYEDEITTGGV